MDVRRILPIFFVVFTNILGAGVILPILPLYAEGQFGATAFQATLLAAVFFAAQFIAAPVLGRISDRVGRRPVLIVSQIGTVLSFVLFVFAGPLGTMLEAGGLELGISGALFMLYVARTLDGITGGNITTAQAYITDISTEETRAQSLGILSAAFGAGFIFGPAFGGFLSTVSLTAPFIGAAIITSFSVLLTAVMLKESLPPEARTTPEDEGANKLPLRQFLSNRTIFLILTINFIATTAFASLQSTFALFAEAVTFPDLDGQTVARNVGFILTFIGLISVINQLALIRPLVERFGERKVAVLGQLALAAGFAGIVATAESPILLTAVTAPIAFGNGVSQPTLQALITRFSNERTRGRLLGIYQSARSLGLIIGPVWAGYVFDNISPRAPYVIAIPLLLTAAALGVRLLRHDIPGERTPASQTAVS